MELVVKNLDTPDDKVSFEHGTLNIVNLASTVIASGTLQPGWRWSTDVKPLVGTESCQASHTGVVLSGRFHIRMDDGTEVELGPGDAHAVSPGHDAWVVGEEPCTIVDFAAVQQAHDDEAPVRAVIEAYAERLRESDVGAILGLYTDDAAVMQPEYETALGSSAIAVRYEEAFAACTMNETFEFERILVDNDLASVRTRSSGQITLKATGEILPVRYRELFVLERVADEWRIAEYMFQSEPEQQQ